MKTFQMTPLPGRRSGAGAPPLRPMAILAMLALGATLAPSAHAALIDFKLTGSRQASFQIDSSRIPDTSNASFFGDSIQYFNVNGVFGGVQETATIGFGTFLFADLNISAAGLGFTQFAGPDLFTGSPSSPNFKFGTFALSSIVSGPSTITISATPAVPEASSWAMMLVGFAGIGFMARRAGRRAGRGAGFRLA
ncbi:PEP-CTERM sorting domain-containing protein [uncultured Rhodoblastus sp.]|uniref:PEP-CTERM sorting domain-containing protein n=1 Tax=uncultured Rhodoblastus sp. TaxID=543037 RepID=UPI0025D13F2D|nr:PEP-CTERM sorting domain-containing protein [uncultured Rhodoblastus sp.]